MNHLQKILFITLLLMFAGVSLLCADTMPMKENETAMGSGDMDLVHPFYTHMGLPDPVGHVSLRLSGVIASENDITKGDFGIHLETGLIKRVGLHVRNDRVLLNAHTEITVQYAALLSNDGMKGIAPFVELEVPTHKGENKFYGLVGISTMWSAERWEWSQSIEYSPKEHGLEGSASLAVKVFDKFFPIVEYVMETAKDTAPQNTMIGGMKYRITDAFDLGVGYQFPVTDSQAYSHQILIQTDIEF